MHGKRRHYVIRDRVRLIFVMVDAVGVASGTKISRTLRDGGALRFDIAPAAILLDGKPQDTGRVVQPWIGGGDGINAHDAM